MKIVQILGFASAISSVTHGNEYSTPASDFIKSTMFTTKEENRIKRGSPDATIKDYPYIASLRLEGLDTTFCSGTLIGSQYILTAGHCIKTETDVVVAHLGTDFGSSSKGEQIKVISSYRHQTNLYDVGLLKLEKPSTQKKATLCAADGSDNPIGTKATALEWGMTEDDSLSHTLQEVHVSLISNAECNKQYNYNNMEGMMCAGYGGVKDSCSGGNGGSLVTADDILIGFASWRGKCGVNVGIYTRLTFVIDYVNAILSGGTGSNFTDSTVSATQQTSIALSTTEIAYTTMAARSIPGSTTLAGFIAKSTSAVTPVAATSTPAGTLALTTVAQMVPIASDCTFRRHLSEEPAPATEEPKLASVEVIEQDLDTAKRVKKIVHAVTAEADKEIEMWSGDSSKDDKIADILRTKAAAEEEEQELDEEIREDEEEEKEVYEEEIEKIWEEDEDKIEQEKREDDTSAKTSDKSSKKTSTKAKAESEEKEETFPISTKATKKPAKKSKAEEEKEEEDKLEEAEKLEEEFQEVLQEQEEEAAAEEEEEADKKEKKKEEDEDDDEDEDKEVEDEDEDEDKEVEDEGEEDEDEAPPPTKKPSKNLKSEESKDAKQKEVAREKRAEKEDEAKGQLEEFGSSP